MLEVYSKPNILYIAVARKRGKMSQEKELHMHRKKGGRTAVVMGKIQLVYHCYLGISFRYWKAEGIRIHFQVS